MIGAALGAGAVNAVDAKHFAERHGLILIIALGEAIIVVGATLADEPPSWQQQSRRSDRRDPHDPGSGLSVGARADPLPTRGPCGPARGRRTNERRSQPINATPGPEVVRAEFSLAGRTTVSPGLPVITRLTRPRTVALRHGFAGSVARSRVFGPAIIVPLHCTIPPGFGCDRC